MREFLPLVEKWMDGYLTDPVKIKNYLITSSSAREIARSVYQYFVNIKELTPIENLDEATKKRLWATATGWNKELSKEEKIKLSKTLYLMENLLQTEIV
jgi:hypothetical protein